MDSLENKHPSVDTLLAVMSIQMGTLLKSVENIEKKLESKVDLVHFEKLERSFEEHKKETVEKINGHAVKIGIGTALLTAGSWLISLLK
jgi:hypothetical protein